VAKGLGDGIDAIGDGLSTAVLGIDNPSQEKEKKKKPEVSDAMASLLGNFDSKVNLQGFASMKTVR